MKKRSPSLAATIEAIRVLASAAVGRELPASAPPATHPVFTAPMSGKYRDPSKVGGWAGWVEDDLRTWIGFVKPTGEGVFWGARETDGKVVGDPSPFRRDPTTLRAARAWARDIGPDAVHVDGPLKVVRHGVEFCIDYPVGSKRLGVDSAGVAWEEEMKCAYGYIAGTTGLDGQCLDAFVGEHEKCREVHIITTVKANGVKDEQKAMVCCGTMAEACKTFFDHVPSKYFGTAFSMPVRAFKAALRAAQKEPEKAFEFTHAVAPASPAEPDDDDRGAPSTTTQVAPSLWLHVDGSQDAVYTRLLEDAAKLSPADAFLMRAAPVVAGGIRSKDREVDCVMSDETVDSYGTILRAKWDLRRFVGEKANPVLLWAHKRDVPPIGTVPRVGVDEKRKALLGTAKFDTSAPLDELVWQKYEKQVMRAFSVGFNPKSAEIEVINGEEIVVFPESELTELSCVPVPANLGALALDARGRVMQMARSAGGRLVMNEGLSAALNRAYEARSYVPLTAPVQAREQGTAPPPKLGLKVCVGCGVASARSAAKCGCGAATDPAAIATCPGCDSDVPKVRAECPICATRMPPAPPASAPAAPAATIPAAEPVLDIPWNPIAAELAVRAWASDPGGDPAKFDWEKYGRAFALKLGDGRALSDFQVQLYAVRDGVLVCVRGALSAAVGIVNGDVDIKIPPEAVAGLRSDIGVRYVKAGLPSPWAEENKDESRAPVARGENAMLKPILKTTIRTIADGASVVAPCAHCQGELEVNLADLPVAPEQTRLLATVQAEKASEVSRAASLEASNRALATFAARLADESIVREFTALSGKKFDPADLPGELHLARSYLAMKPNLVPIDEKRADSGFEIEGMRMVSARLALLGQRADIGMVTGAVTTTGAAAGAGARAGDVDATAAGQTPAGAPPMRTTGPVVIKDKVTGAISTTGGSAFAKLVQAAADKPS